MMVVLVEEAMKELAFEVEENNGVDKKVGGELGGVGGIVGDDDNFRGVRGWWRWLAAEQPPITANFHKNGWICTEKIIETTNWSFFEINNLKIIFGKCIYIFPYK